MTAQRWPAWFAILLAALVLSAPALGQEGTGATSVRAALEAMRDAPKHERAEKRQQLVQLGAGAVDALIAQVQKHKEAADLNFAANCIMALGELKARPATDALLGVLDGGNPMLKYLACSALGEIWAAGNDQDETARRVTARLVATLQNVVAPAAVYGPALAIIQVNDAPIQKPRAMQPEELAGQVLDWVARNPDALPPPAEQPWQLNLRAALTNEDAGRRQAHLQALRQKRPLGLVEPVLAMLAETNSVPQDLRAELGNILGEVSGIPFPPQGLAADATIAEQTYTWRWSWLAKLTEANEGRYVEYAWGEFEGALRAYEVSPSEEAAAQVRYYRTIVLNQLSGPGALPAGASAKATELTRRPLEIKQRIAEAVRVLEEATGDFQKATQLKRISEEADKEFGQEVGRMFLGRIAAKASEERNLNIARQMGTVLSKISGIPCDLGYSDIAKRRDQLAKWRDALERAGISIDVPVTT